MTPVSGHLYSEIRLKMLQVNFGPKLTRRLRAVGCFASSRGRVNIISYHRAAFTLVSRFFLHQFLTNPDGWGLILVA
jgi:hypothetical protein